jgi:hypothetical protein
VEQPAPSNDQSKASACACCGGVDLALTRSINGAHYCDQCAHTLRRMMGPQPREAARRSAS